MAAVGTVQPKKQTEERSGEGDVNSRIQYALLEYGSQRLD